MDIKRALLYNLIAVIPSFLGVAIGIVLGENTHASTWILAIAGGMFVYIAFVDMVCISQAWPRDYKKCFMLNLAEHDSLLINMSIFIFISIESFTLG